MSTAELTLSLAIDGHAHDAITLLACLTLCGVCVSDAMLHVRDAVRAGLVTY